MTIININGQKLKQMLEKCCDELLGDPEVSEGIRSNRMDSRLVKSICAKAGLEAYPNLDSVSRPVWSFRKKEWPEREPDIYLREKLRLPYAC